MAAIITPVDDSSNINEALSAFIIYLQAGLAIPQSINDVHLNLVAEFTEEVLQSTKPSETLLSSPFHGDITMVAQSTIFRNLINKPTKPDLLVNLYEDKSQGLSVEEACHVLDGIIGTGSLLDYTTQVERLATQLCDTWLARDGPFSSPSCCLSLAATLLASSLVRLLRAWHESSLSPSNNLRGVKIPLVLFQVWFQIVQLQNADGSWSIEGCNQSPTYPILTLIRLHSLVLLEDLDSKNRSAVLSGQIHIDLANDRVGIVEKSYSVVARQTSLAFSEWKLHPSAIPVSIPEKKLAKFVYFFSKLPCAQGIEPWRLRAAMAEGFLFLPMLMQHRIDMFDREGMKDEMYLPFIAFTFTCANNLRPFHVSADILFDMMILTLRAYQLDEFVEHVIGKHFGDSTDDMKALIHGIFEDDDDRLKETLDKKVDPTVSRVYTALAAFRDIILLHPAVIAASEYNRNILKNELREYLLAHITQLEDSKRFYQDKTIPFGSYNTWVRTSGATHVFVAFSLAYLHCLDPKCRDSACSAEMRYIIQDVWLHLGKKVRMENDHPSLVRDRKERNLNSLDFPEFRLGSNGSETVEEARKALIRIILYEKQRCEMALGILKDIVGGSDPNLQMLTFYYFLTDVVGDVYAARDISTEV